MSAAQQQAFEAACNCETFFTLPDGRRVIRFVTSWATQPSDVDELTLPLPRPWPRRDGVFLRADFSSTGTRLCARRTSAQFLLHWNAKLPLRPLAHFRFHWKPNMRARINALFPI